MLFERSEFIELFEEFVLRPLSSGRFRALSFDSVFFLADQKENEYRGYPPGGQESGTKPATTDAKSYESNCLVPTIEATNYEAGQYLILKNNEFHSIAANASKVKACKAVFSKTKAGVK